MLAVVLIQSAILIPVSRIAPVYRSSRLVSPHHSQITVSAPFPPHRTKVITITWQDYFCFLFAEGTKSRVEDYLYLIDYGGRSKASLLGMLPTQPSL